MLIANFLLMRFGIGTTSEYQYRVCDPEVYINNKPVRGVTDKQLERMSVLFHLV